MVKKSGNTTQAAEGDRGHLIGSIWVTGDPVAVTGLSLVGPAGWLQPSRPDHLPFGPDLPAAS
jgi:hypothetical protein